MGGWTMPQPPDKLKQLLLAQTQMGQPPAPSGATPGTLPSSTVQGGIKNPGAGAYIPYPNGMNPANPQPPAPPKPPSPTDDPAVSGMPALPKPPDYSTSPYAAESARYRGMADQRAALQPPDPNSAEYQPKWWQKALAIPVAALGGRNAPVYADAILHGKYNRAETSYKAKSGALDKQLDYERRIGVPLAEDQAKIPQTNFENQMGVAKEKREQQVGEGRISQYQSRADELQAQRDRLQFQIDHPKMQTVRNSAEALSASMQTDDPAMKAQYKQLHDMLLREEQNKLSLEHPDHGEKPATKGQFNQADVRKQQALTRAEAEYRKTARDAASPEEKQDALDRLNQDKQAAQDAYEQEVGNLGGSPGHFDYSAKNPKPAPTAAAPKPSAPASQPGASSVTDTTKTVQIVGKSVVQKYADNKKLTFDQAKKALESTGKYKVQ